MQETSEHTRGPITLQRRTGRPIIRCWPAHIAVQILADTICGNAERFDVFERIQHWKLPGGKWFANPALALGMLYYRLKEIL